VGWTRLEKNKFLHKKNGALRKSRLEKIGISWLRRENGIKKDVGAA